jgi:hypothetical protein
MTFTARLHSISARLDQMAELIAGTLGLLAAVRAQLQRMKGPA